MIRLDGATGARTESRGDKDAPDDVDHCCTTTRKVESEQGRPLFLLACHHGVIATVSAGEGEGCGEGGVRR
jgi:hypothetical protein